MKRFSAVLFILMALLVANPAQAFNWTHYDFGATPFDENNNTAPIEYPYGIGNLPSPGTLGEGGEKFDLEGLFVAADNDYLYVSLTNSFGKSVYSTGWDRWYEMGDIFFGMGDNSYAIDVQTGRLVEVGAWTGILNEPGTYYNYTSIRDRVGAWQVTQGLDLGDANEVTTFWPGLEDDPMSNYESDTYTLEYKIDRSLFNWDGTSDLFFHATLGCGNDLVERSLTAIPEPTTLILLGLGLVGAGMISRRK